MGFFKKIFSSKKETQINDQQENNVKEVFTDEYFNKRYTEYDSSEDAETLDGCFKMLESYFIDNKIQRKVDNPINHPINLDQVIYDGFGFKMYCQALKIPDGQVIFFLAFAFSDFLIKNYGFKLYKDSEPEFPLRSMTLKYSKDKIVLSIYPYEYSLKVLNDESTFDSLYNKLDAQLEKMPNAEDLLKKFIDDIKDNI
jgi:hypothetical protein